MNLYNSAYNNKEKIGKILFFVSAIMFVYMFFSPMARTYIHVDEHFTVNILGLPFNDLINKTVTDGHPPLHYFVNYVPAFILSIFNIPIDYFKITKFTSILTYGIILVISATKFKKDYGWFTAGLFAFVLAIMSGFFVQFVTSRSYGLDILLLLLSFIYFKDVLFESDAESWILFVVFTLLGAYSHYYLVFPIGFMYLMIIGNILENKRPDFKNEIKKVVLAVIASIILYLPQLYILTITMTYPINNGSGANSFFDLISFVVIGKYQSAHLDVVFFKIIALLFIIGIAIVAIRKFMASRENEDRYILAGILLFFLTLVLGYYVLPMKFGPLTGKYLSPVIAIFWLSTSILMGKIQDKRLLTVFLVLILLFSCVGVGYISEQTTKLYEKGTGESSALDMINNDNSVVVYGYGNVYHNFHYKLNNTKEYALSLTNIPYDNDVTVERNVSKIIDDNPGKDVYVIKPVKTKKDKNFGDDISVDVIFDKSYSILKVTK